MDTLKQASSLGWKLDKSDPKELFCQLMRADGIRVEVTFYYSSQTYSVTTSNDESEITDLREHPSHTECKFDLNKEARVLWLVADISHSGVL